MLYYLLKHYRIQPGCVWCHSHLNQHDIDTNLLLSLNILSLVPLQGKERLLLQTILARSHRFSSNCVRQFLVWRGLEPAQHTLMDRKWIINYCVAVGCQR